MALLAFERSTLALLAAGGILVGCGASSSPSVPRMVSSQVVMDSSSGYKELYRFRAGYDASGPIPGLTSVNGTYYGATFEGGANGRGAIFSVTSTGKERVIYSFKASPDCAFPFGPLLNVSGTLYGTGLDGGANNEGCVFTVSTSGNEKVIYSFQSYGSGDAANPHSGLIDVNDVLYGTTESGGANDKGTVFKVTPSGNEGVIYSFKGGKDGEVPYAGLFELNGTLYGTTTGGSFGSGPLRGTVFSVTTSGTEKVLYNFKGPPDGADPWASLVAVNGSLYGTTYLGGSSGWGTVFSITTSGKEKVIHSFKGFADGRGPYAPLVVLDGTLYGTTVSGGRNSQCSYSGCGAVYSITTSGTEKVVYGFKDDPDGANPEGGLLVQGKVLYGTTLSGGYGYGTVFELTP